MQCELLCKCIPVRYIQHTAQLGHMHFVCKGIKNLPLTTMNVILQKWVWTKMKYYSILGAHLCTCIIRQSPYSKCILSLYTEKHLSFHMKTCNQRSSPIQTKVLFVLQTTLFLAYNFYSHIVCTIYRARRRFGNTLNLSF